MYYLNLPACFSGPSGADAENPNSPGSQQNFRFAGEPSEGFFSVLKRGLVGTYQHVDVKHLDRYLAEFDFRQNTRAKLGINDAQRADLALKGFVGKRLTYGTTQGATEA